MNKIDRVYIERNGSKIWQIISVDNIRDDVMPLRVEKYQEVLTECLFDPWLRGRLLLHPWKTFYEES